MSSALELPVNRILEASSKVGQPAMADLKQKPGESLHDYGVRLKQADKALWDSQKHPRGAKGSGQGGKFVTKGSSGSDVKKVQKAVGVKQDGSFGDKTHNAVVGFQKKHGLKVDGIVGAQTMAQIDGKDGKKVAPGPMKGTRGKGTRGQTRGRKLRGVRASRSQQTSSSPSSSGVVVEAARSPLEVPVRRILEATYEEGRHPRGRGGKWIESLAAKLRTHSGGRHAGKTLVMERESGKTSIEPHNHTVDPNTHVAIAIPHARMDDAGEAKLVRALQAGERSVPTVEQLDAGQGLPVPQHPDDRPGGDLGAPGSREEPGTRTSSAQIRQEAHAAEPHVRERLHSAADALDEGRWETAESHLRQAGNRSNDMETRRRLHRLAWNVKLT